MKKHCPSISISGEAFARLREYCERQNIGVSSLVEQLVVDITGDKPVRRPFVSRRYFGRRGVQ